MARMISCPFALSVAVLVNPPEVREAVTQSLLAPPPTEELAAMREGVQFLVRTVDCSEALLSLVQSQLRSKRASRMVVVSDQIVEKVADQDRPNALASEIRNLFNAQATHLLALVALVDGEPGHLTDIDVTVDRRTLSLAILQSAFSRVAHALWLKSVPSVQRTLQDGNAIKVRFVRTLDELRACLRLRFLVYGALGYLERRVASLAAQMELDTYDQHALHLCAVERTSLRIVGTLRLVLAPDRQQVTRRQRVPEDLVLRNVRALPDVVWIHRLWIRTIADEEPVLGDKLREENPLTPLPIMDSTDFGDLWPQFLQAYDYRETAEISRVIVSPEYRGLGVSALLMRAAIAAAAEVGVRHLLLECIPTHVRMYEQHGFEPLPRRHCRARELDQFAVGMRLEMEAMPREALTKLQGDLDMLRRGLKPGTVLLGSRGLCLCRQCDCWKEGRYSGWALPTCPLVTDMPVI